MRSGGSLPAANTVIRGSFAVPSLSAYHDLFAICGAASLLAALVVLVVPRHPTHGDSGSVSGLHDVRRVPGETGDDDPGQRHRQRDACQDDELELGRLDR